MDETFTGLGTIDLDAGRYVRVVGTEVELSVLGQVLTGNFVLESATTATGEPVVKVAVADVTLQLAAGGTVFLDVLDADGGFIITSQGVAASLDINGVQFNVPGLDNFNIALATLQLRFNSIPTPVEETFSVNIGGAGVMVEVDLPAGPFVEIAVEGLTVNIAAITVTGDFLFSQETTPLGIVTKIGIANFSATIQFNGEGIAVTEGEGGFVVLTSGVAGFVSAVVDASAGPVSLSGDVTVRINTTLIGIDETIVVGGRSIPIRFGQDESAAGTIFELSFSNLSLNIADFVTIEGSIAFTTVGNRSTFAGDGLDIFLGQGPARLENGDINPLATGVLLSDARIGLIKLSGAAGDTFALHAEGTIRLLGVEGISITGTAVVDVNNTGLVIDETLTVGDTTVAVSFTTGAQVTLFQALDAELDVLAQVLRGDFSFDRAVNPMTGEATLRIAASGVDRSEEHTV